jgi:NhaP-type Na+/H+ or K+/H+ antiporter
LELETAFAVIAGVLVVSALAAGLVERAPLSFPMLFLGPGFLIGDRGLQLVSIGLDNQVLQVVAVVTLALVLFLDAVNLEFTELRRDWLAPFLVLGPATLLVAGVARRGRHAAVDLPVVLALLLETILASTDPVVLRDVLRDSCIPGRCAGRLSVEAGTNDIVVLPILLVLIAIAHADLGGPAEWLVFLGQLFVLGPAAGFAVGAAGAWTMGWVDSGSASAASISRCTASAWSWPPTSPARRSAATASWPRSPPGWRSPRSTRPCATASWTSGRSSPR